MTSRAFQQTLTIVNFN